MSLNKLCRPVAEGSWTRRHRLSLEITSQVRCELLHRCIALHWLFPHGAKNDCVQVTRQPPGQRAIGMNSLARMRERVQTYHALHLLWSGMGNAMRPCAGEQFIQDHAQRINV